MRRGALALILAWAVSGSHAAESVQPTVSATAGVTFDDVSVRIGLMEARFAVTSRITLAAGVAYLETEPDYEEAQLRLMGTGTFSSGAWALENRHMLSVSTASVERYRTRVRLLRSGLLGRGVLSFRAFDELFFDFDEGRFFRNNVAIGFGAQICGRCTFELYRVWVDERRGRGEDYTLALLTIRLPQP